MTERGIIRRLIEDLLPGTTYILTVAVITDTNEVGAVSVPVTALTDSGKLTSYFCYACS